MVVIVGEYFGNCIIYIFNYCLWCVRKLNGWWCLVVFGMGFEEGVSKVRVGVLVLKWKLEGDFFLFVDFEVFLDVEIGFSLVQGVKVQFGCVGFEQFFIYFSDYFFIKFVDVDGIVFVGFQLFLDLVGDFGIVYVGELYQVGEIDDGYDVWYYWNGDVYFFQVVD